MEVIIYTSDPEEVNPEEVYAALEAAGYFVASVTVNDRMVDYLDRA